MSGQWPPDWEDSDTGLPDEWTDSDAALDPEASEVSLFLASVPSPMLPASFEARISAAIAAEATARADGTASAGARSAETDPAGADSAGPESAGRESAGPGFAGAKSAGPGFARAELDGAGSAGAGVAAAGTGDAKATDRSSSQEVSPTAAESGPATAARHRRRRTSAASRSAAAKSRPAGSRPDGRRRRFRLPSSGVTATLVVFLVIAGFAVVLTQLGGGFSSGSESNGSGTSAQGVASSSASASSRHAASVRPVPLYEGPSGQPVVIQSGTRYQGSTLVRQVREQLNALVTPTGGVPSASGPNIASATAEPAGSASVPAASSPSASAAAGAAPRGLAGCVTHLTRGVTPALVDQATYDGIPAYIIATSDRVWVVRRGCTAADPRQITSASLSG